MAETKIEWRAVPGFPAYRISSDGQIESCWGKGGKVRKMTDCWRQINGDICEGYRRIVLRTGIDGNFRRVFVHVLMLEVFIGPRPNDRMESCHRDGDRLNCKIDNLYWGTPEANWEDKRKHGRATVGIRQSQSKLTDAAVVDIRKERRAGIPLRVLAKRYGVSMTKISHVATGKNWRHVDG